MILANDLNSGTAVASEIPVTSADLLFSPIGVAASLGRTPDGDLLIANQRPAIWYLMHHGRITEHGALAVQVGKALVVGRRVVSPSQALGIGSFAENRVGVLYATVTHADTSDTDRDAAIDLFESSGRYLGTANLPLPSKNGFAVARDGRSFYVAFIHPYPHITEFRLNQQPIRAELNRGR